MTNKQLKTLLNFIQHDFEINRRLDVDTIKDRWKKY